MAPVMQQALRTGQRLARRGNRLLSTSTRLLAEENVASSSSSSSIVSGGHKPFPNLLRRNDIEVGPVRHSRYEEHYNMTLARDLLYMTYDHRLDTADRDAIEAKQRRVERDWDPSSPYSTNRPQRPNKGLRNLIPAAANYAHEVVALERITITAFAREAITNKNALIPLLAQIRAITGAPVLEGDADPSIDGRSGGKAPKKGHVTIIKAKKNVATFKIRRGLPVGVKAVLPSKEAYKFLEVLSTFVLPRLRTFNGFYLPPASQLRSSAAAVSGVVNLGMQSEAMGLFPQTEVNWDSYPNRPVGFQIDFVTNQRGHGATEKARQLLSGLGIPFVRRSGM